MDWIGERFYFPWNSQDLKASSLLFQGQPAQPVFKASEMKNQAPKHQGTMGEQDNLTVWKVELFSITTPLPPMVPETWY